MRHCLDHFRHRRCSRFDSAIHLRYLSPPTFARRVPGAIHVSSEQPSTSVPSAWHERPLTKDPTISSGGYIISAILICAEYLRLGLSYRRQHRVLLASFIIKVTFAIIEIALAIAFGICTKSKDKSKKNTGAILEWVIAFVFTGYVLSFVVDLLPSVRTRTHVPQGEKHASMMTTPRDSGDLPPHASLEEPLTTDSMGPNAGYYRGQRV
jgi:hypothetical protein